MNSAGDYWGLPSRVAPFGNPRVSLLPANRGLSQVTTSFFASRYQGIHHTPLIAWSKNLTQVYSPKGITLEILYPLVAWLVVIFQLPKHSTVKDRMRQPIDYRKKTMRVQKHKNNNTNGGDVGDRTPGLRLAKPALYQLSYIPGINRSLPFLMLQLLHGGPGRNRTTDLTLIRRAL